MTTVTEEREQEATQQVTLRIPVRVHDRARFAAAYWRTSVNTALVKVLDEHLPQVPADFETKVE